VPVHSEPRAVKSVEHLLVLGIWILFQRSAAYWQLVGTHPPLVPEPMQWAPSPQVFALLGSQTVVQK
jgi:hypothetical protein